MRGREGWRWGACLAPPRPVPLRRTFLDAGLALGAVTLALGAAALALGAADLALGLATVVFLPGAAAFALGAALALPAALAVAAAAFLVAGTALPLAALTALALAGWWGEEGAGRDEGKREGSQRLRWASANRSRPALLFPHTLAHFDDGGRLLDRRFFGVLGRGLGRGTCSGCGRGQRGKANVR